MNHINKKLFRNLEELDQWRKKVRRQKTIVATNGCFDLIHVGHIDYLTKARSLGDYLIIGLNSDQSVGALKGPGRPVNTEIDRAYVLSAMEIVDKICIFEGKTATEFLKKCRPDIWVKGGDYTIETLDKEEVGIVLQSGGRIEIVPVVRNISTTKILGLSR